MEVSSFIEKAFGKYSYNVYKRIIIKKIMHFSILSIDYIKRIAGARTVPVELGLRYTDEDWRQELMNVGDFIDKYILLEDKQEV